MAIERNNWKDGDDLGPSNIELRLRFANIDRSLRTTVQAPPTAAGVVVMTSARTLLEVDTSGGALSYTLPPAASVIGAVLEATVTGANGLTLVPSGSETVDGQPDIETYTRVTLVAKATGWAEL